MADLPQWKESGRGVGWVGRGQKKQAQLGIPRQVRCQDEGSHLSTQTLLQVCTSSLSPLGTQLLATGMGSPKWVLLIKRNNCSQRRGKGCGTLP